MIPVPDGTVVFDEHGLVADLVGEGARAVVAQGGRGGRGNVAFASARNRVPRTAEPGEEGEEKRLQRRAAHGRRRRARRAPERRQVDAAVAADRGQAEDRGLPLHHAHAEPRRRRRRRRSVRRGRHPRARSRARARAGASATGSSGTSCAVGRWCSSSTCPPRPGRRPGDPPRRSSPPTTRRSSTGRRSWWGRRPTSSTIRPRPRRPARDGALADLGDDRRRDRRPARRGSACSRSEAEAAQPERQPYVVLRPGRPRFTVTRDGPAPVAGGGPERRALGHWRPTSTTSDDVERLQKRLVEGRCRAQARELGARATATRSQILRPRLRVPARRRRADGGRRAAEVAE